MCDLHALHDNVEFINWGSKYSDAGIEVLDEYVKDACADGFITVCKDVCDVIVEIQCSNPELEPIEVCEIYPVDDGKCELADLHDNVAYINNGFKYSNAEIEVIDENVTNCADGFITVCKTVCEVNIKLSYEITLNRLYLYIHTFGESSIASMKRNFRYIDIQSYISHAFRIECSYRKAYSYHMTSFMYATYGPYRLFDSLFITYES